MPFVAAGPCKRHHNLSPSQERRPLRAEFNRCRSGVFRPILIPWRHPVSRKQNSFSRLQSVAYERFSSDAES